MSTQGLTAYERCVWWPKVSVAISACCGRSLGVCVSVCVWLEVYCRSPLGPGLRAVSLYTSVTVLYLTPDHRWYRGHRAAAQRRYNGRQRLHTELPQINTEAPNRSFKGFGFNSSDVDMLFALVTFMRGRRNAETMTSQSWRVGWAGAKGAARSQSSQRKGRTLLLPPQQIHQATQATTQRYGK